MYRRSFTGKTRDFVSSLKRLSLILLSLPPSFFCSYLRLISDSLVFPDIPILRFAQFSPRRDKTRTVPQRPASATVEGRLWQFSIFAFPFVTQAEGADSPVSQFCKVGSVPPGPPFVLMTLKTLLLDPRSVTGSDVRTRFASDFLILF